MRKTAFASALVLAMIGSSFAMAEGSHGSAGHIVQAAAHGPTLTHQQISSFHSVLKLRPEQQQYWPAVERVLRGMVRQASAGTRAGLVQRLSARAYEMASDVSGLRQLAAAAKPLVQSLDDDQKFAALQFVNDMGYGAVVAAF